MPAKAGDAEEAVKATMLMMTVTCLPTQYSKPPTAEQLRYFGDSMFVVSLAQGGMNKELLDRAEKSVIDYVEKIGEAEFCKQYLPQLDKAVQIARTEMPQELDEFWRWQGRKK
jgi:hypothetical protein